MPVQDSVPPLPTTSTGTEAPLALSVDVEDYFQVQAFARRVSREDWERFPQRVEQNTHRLLDLFEAVGAQGTFFVLGWVGQRHPRLIRRIAACGHEVASHGMTHTMLTEMTPDDLRGEARESRMLLEDLCGSRILGFRAPSYSITRRTLWALDVLAEAGYEYDSSIYPIRRRRYGYPEGPKRPVRLDTGSAVIAEFPLPTIGLGPLRLPVLAGSYLRLLPSWISVAAVRHYLKHGIPLVVNIHPWEIDPDQPTVGPSRLHTWTHYAGLGSSYDTLRRILQSGRFAGIASRLRDLGLLAVRTTPEVASR